MKVVNVCVFLCLLSLTFVKSVVFVRLSEMSEGCVGLSALNYWDLCGLLNNWELMNSTKYV